MTYLGITCSCQWWQVIFSATEVNVVCFYSPAICWVQLNMEFVAGVPDAAISNINMVPACKNF